MPKVPGCPEGVRRVCVLMVSLGCAQGSGGTQGFLRVSLGCPQRVLRWYSWGTQLREYSGGTVLGGTQGVLSRGDSGGTQGVLRGTQEVLRGYSGAEVYEEWGTQCLVDC